MSTRRAQSQCGTTPSRARLHLGIHRVAHSDLRRSPRPQGAPMKFLCFALLLFACSVSHAEPTPAPRYEIRREHDPDGIGKFYLGREIAQVMGPGGILWLDRAEREVEERP